jgi:hypothetical protein
VDDGLLGKKFQYGYGFAAIHRANYFSNSGGRGVAGFVVSSQAGELVCHAGNLGVADFMHILHDNVAGAPGTQSD